MLKTHVIIVLDTIHGDGGVHGALLWRGAALGGEGEIECHVVEVSWARAVSG